MPALLCVSFVRRFIFILFILLSIHSIYLRILPSVVPYLPEWESSSHSCRCAAVCFALQPSRSHHPAWLAISDNTHLLVQTTSSEGVSTYWLYLLSSHYVYIINIILPASFVNISGKRQIVAYTWLLVTGCPSFLWCNPWRLMASAIWSVVIPPFLFTITYTIASS